MLDEKKPKLTVRIFVHVGVPNLASFHSAREVLENALGSIFDRLTLPVVLERETKAKSVRYFSHISEKLIPLGSNVQVAPSGGVVRSGIGYVHAQIREGLKDGIPPENYANSKTGKNSLKIYTMISVIFPSAR